MIANRFPWLYGRVPNGFWDYRENRVQYLDWLGVQCGFVEIQDWYVVRKSHFVTNRGGGMLHNCYRDSVVSAMQDYRPEFDWSPWKFCSVPQGFWKDKERRLAYMKWLGAQLGYSAHADWYDITKQSFKDHYGAGLLQNQFGNSPQRAVFEYMPEYDWKPWLFRSVPQNFWHDADRRLQFLHWLGQQLHFSSPVDWVRLSGNDFRKNAGGGLLDYYSRDPIARALSEPLHKAPRFKRAPIWPLIQLIECSLTGRPPETILSAVL